MMENTAVQKTTNVKMTCVALRQCPWAWWCHLAMMSWIHLISYVLMDVQNARMVTHVANWSLESLGAALYLRWVEWWNNWRTFRTTFSNAFCGKKFLSLASSFTEVCSLVMVQPAVMAWCWASNKPLPEPMEPRVGLRGGTPPWGVIFHENVNFLFVAKKCKVTHTFHKIHKQYVIAVIETHILVNYFNKTVFGDLCFSAKN